MPVMGMRITRFPVIVILHDNSGVETFLHRILSASGAVVAGNVNVLDGTELGELLLDLFRLHVGVCNTKAVHFTRIALQIIRTNQILTVTEFVMLKLEERKIKICHAEVVNIIAKIMRTTTASESKLLLLMYTA